MDSKVWFMVHDCIMTDIQLGTHGSIKNYYTNAIA